MFTHFHPDHIRGFHRVRAGRVLAPVGEEPYAGSLERLALRFAGEMWREWIDMARLAMDLQGVPEPSEYFRPGEDLCLRGVCLKTYPARGHLLTHTLLEAPGGVVHLVDIDLTGFGPWYGNPEASPELFLLDIRAAAGLEAGEYVSAHKDRVYTRGEALEALARFASRIVEQAEGVHRALAQLGRPGGPEDLAGRGVIYRRYLEGLEAVMGYFERMMIEKLLGLLGVWGCVSKTPGGSRPWTAASARLGIGWWARYSPSSKHAHAPQEVTPGVVAGPTYRETLYRTAPKEWSGAGAMAKVRIIAKKNGPYLLEVDGRVQTALCRCGHSNNKPYCDGTHAKVGFQAEEKVAFEAEF